MSEVLTQMGRRRADTKDRIALAIPARTRLAPTGGVIGLLIYLMLILVTIAGAKAAMAQSVSYAPGVMLQSGIEKEDVDGDVKAAMTIYEKVAADLSAPRDVRAKALLRLAGCDEKLGKQAKVVYEQIVQEYADQPAAVKARTRLAAIRKQEYPVQPVTTSVTKIERNGLGQMDPWDTDGKRAAYVAADGNLYVGDLAGHSRRLVFKVQPGGPVLNYWLPSKDFSKVLLLLQPISRRPQTLAVINIDGSGYRELIRSDEEKDVLQGSPKASWSWDDRRFLLTVNSVKSGAHIYIVDLSDRNQLELVHNKNEYFICARFSPDGQFVSYESSGINSDDPERIFTIPANGGESRLVYESESGLAALMDWTADGRYLIVHDIRDNAPEGLYLLPIKNGLPSGEIQFARAAGCDYAVTTLSGSLVYTDTVSSSSPAQAFLGSIDANEHIGNWRSLGLRGYTSNSWPSFSADSTRLVYRAVSADMRQTDLVVLEIASGKQRIIYHSTNGRLFCTYSNIKLKVFCTQAERDGAETKTDLFAVDDNSQQIEQIALLQGSKGILDGPVDTKWFYFVNLGDKVFEVTRWDRETQQETIVVPGPQSLRQAIELPSFDGRWLFRIAQGDSLSVRAMPDGDWKTLVSGAKGLYAYSMTYDGHWAYYAAYDSNGKFGLFRVSTAGGTPQCLGDLPVQPFKGNLYLSPDKHQILALNMWGYELWLLENFEPTPKKKQD